MKSQAPQGFCRKHSEPRPRPPGGPRSDHGRPSQMRVVLFFLLALVSLAGAATAGVIRGKLVLPSRPNVSPVEAVVYVSPLPDALQRKWGPKRGTFTVIQ